jgi:hypothetical protein
MSVFLDLMIQAAYYGVVLILGVFVVSFFLKGFFWKYVKVRLSFGRKVLVKIRSQLTDYYAIGRIEDSFLVYENPNKKSESQSDEIRVSLPPQKNCFYRSLAINCIDIDEETFGICTVNYGAVTGFDAVKYSDLLTRALMRPAENTKVEKIILLLLAIILVGVLASIFLGYSNYSSIKTMQTITATITGSPTLI